VAHQTLRDHARAMHNGVDESYWDYLIYAVTALSQRQDNARMAVDLMANCFAVFYDAVVVSVTTHYSKNTVAKSNVALPDCKHDQH